MTLPMMVGVLPALMMKLPTATATLLVMIEPTTCRPDASNSHFTNGMTDTALLPARESVATRPPSAGRRRTTTKLGEGGRIICYRLPWAN